MTTNNKEPSPLEAEVARLRAELARERKTRVDAEIAGSLVSRGLDEARKDLERMTEELEQNRASLRKLGMREQEAVVRLARTLRPGRLSLGDSLRELTQVSSASLSVERVSVWLLSPNGQDLRCLDLYERSLDRHSDGVVLSAARYPRYFAALETGRAIAAHDARTDPSTSEFTEGYLVPLGITSMMDSAIRLDGAVVGVVCHEHVGLKRTWSVDEISFAGSLADQVALILAAEERQRLARESERVRGELARTQELARRDALTDLYNRRELDRLLEQEAIRCKEDSRPLSVAMLDIDHFKSINDRYGHPVGDVVLRQIAQLVRGSVRSRDTALRYGGEEIVLVLPEAPGEAAFGLLDRLRRRIEEQRFSFTHDGAPTDVKVTVSIGVAEIPSDGLDPEEAVQLADAAMYEAKLAGRNRVMRARPKHASRTSQAHEQAS